MYIRAHSLHIVCNGKFILTVIDCRINTKLIICPLGHLIMAAGYGKLAPSIPYAAEI